MESFLHQISGSTLTFVKDTHQKAANFTFCLILPVRMVPWWFLGGQFNQEPYKSQFCVKLVGALHFKERGWQLFLHGKKYLDILEPMFPDEGGITEVIKTKIKLFVYLKNANTLELNISFQSEKS